MHLQKGGRAKASWPWPNATAQQFCQRRGWHSRGAPSTGSGRKKGLTADCVLSSCTRLLAKPWCCLIITVWAAAGQMGFGGRLPGSRTSPGQASKCSCCGFEGYSQHSSLQRGGGLPSPIRSQHRLRKAGRLFITASGLETGYSPFRTGASQLSRSVGVLSPRGKEGFCSAFVPPQDFFLFRPS